MVACCSHCSRRKIHLTEISLPIFTSLADNRDQLSAIGITSTYIEAEIVPVEESDDDEED